MTPLAVVAALLVFWLLLSVEVLNEYERGVIFRLGKVLPRPKGLAEAAGKLKAEPVALHLRYLQTLVEIAAEKKSTVIFPVPIDWMKALMGARRE